MDLLTQLNRAMEYVEANIKDNIELERISSATTYSPYHFGRLFYYISGIPLSEDICCKGSCPSPQWICKTVTTR